MLCKYFLNYASVFYCYARSCTAMLVFLNALLLRFNALLVVFDAFLMPFDALLVPCYCLASNLLVLVAACKAVHIGKEFFLFHM